MSGSINPFIQLELTNHSHAFIGAITLFLALLVHTILLTLRRRPQTRFPVVPGAIPFLGHALSLSDPEEFVTVLTKWAKEVGKDGVYEFSIFGRRFVVLCSTDTTMEAMRLRPHKLLRERGMTSILSSLEVNGLFTAEGPDWKNDRRVVAPFLNKNHIEDYFQSIKLVSNRLVLKWQNELEAVAALTDLSKFSLDIVALSILGVDFDSLGNPDNILAIYVEALLAVIFKRMLPPVAYWKIYSNLDGGRDIAERVANVCRNLIQDCRKKKEEGNSDDELEPTRHRSVTLLQKLIDISDEKDARLEDDRVVGNLSTMIIAGKDTSSSTISACIWEIANDSQLQDELAKEIAQSGLDTESLTMADITNSFPRLQSLLFEVLRLKGPAPQLFLEPENSITLQGKEIKAGTTIIAMTRILGEGAASEVPIGPKGEDPKQFCPRRWLTTSGQAESLTAIQPTNKLGGFLPFGHGLRRCPGAQFAKVEVITGLFFILKKFEIAPIENHPPIRFVSRFSDTYNGEIQLTLKPRV